jgi:hypothetical protein
MAVFVTHGMVGNYALWLCKHAEVYFTMFPDAGPLSVLEKTDVSWHLYVKVKARVCVIECEECLTGGG